MAGDQNNVEAPSGVDVATEAAETAGASTGQPGAAPSERDAAAGDPTQWRRWGNLWQIPTIVLSLVLIGAALQVTGKRAPRNDFEGALDQVDRLIADGELDVARSRMAEAIEPHLDEATDIERGRFDATVADWVFFTQLSEGVTGGENARAVADGYDRARSRGFALNPPRLERWALSAIDAGDLDTARRRLEELEALSLAEDAGPLIRQRRNTVLRKLVEVSLQEPELPYENTMELLAEYRRDGLLGPDDEMWVVTQQALLRMEEGLYSEAVDHLLVDSRRLEKRASDAGLSFAGIYILLGRGYYHLGQTSYATWHLQHALELLEGPEDIRGEALLWLGRLEVSEDDLETALTRFDDVARNYVGTSSFLPGLLGRAEVLSVLGRHEESLEDYRSLQQLLPGAPRRRDITPQRVTRSLVDRHHAAVVRGRIDLALDYLKIGERLHDPARVPQEVLRLLASTNREAAVARIGFEPGLLEPDERVRQIDPEARHAANEHFRRAGDYAVRHVRAVVGLPGGDDLWAESLWLAADSYDLAGEHEKAIEYFAEYVAGRPTLDGNRPEAMFRRGRAHQALLEYEDALSSFEALRQEYPNSPWSDAGVVPMSRCYVALDRRPQAKQLLREILSGAGHLEPAAREYRDALLELGAIHYEAGEFVKAIERLTEAIARYPDELRMPEVLFRLADSYRGEAMEIDARLEVGADLIPAERARLERNRTESLQKGQELFQEVKNRLSDVSPHETNHLQARMLRYSYLNQADCAFYLGEFDRAIALYEHAVRKYSSHHSSMTAMIQIVNCYRALGDGERARAAHNRAMVRLNQLPDGAFETPDALMDRAAWEQWLTNAPLGSVAAVDQL